MAELQKIRNRAGLLIGIVGFALLAFIIPWSALGTMVNKSRDKAFVVNGEVVSTEKYNQRVTQMEEFQKMIYQKSSLTEAQSTQIRDNVYEQMVQEMILADQTDKLGIAISKPELSDMIYGDRPYPLLQQMFSNRDGEPGIDRASLDHFMKNVNRSNLNGLNNQEKAAVTQQQFMWSVISTMMTDQRMAEKYQTLIAGALVVNDLEAKDEFQANATTANIAYVQKSYNTIPDSTIVVSNSEIEKLYNERKNNFKMQSERAKITFFVKDILPSQEDYAESKKDMDAIVQKLHTSDNPALIVADNSDLPYLDAYIAEKDLPANQQNFVKTAAVGDVFDPVIIDKSYVTGKLLDKTLAPDSVKLQIIAIPPMVEKTATAHVADSLMLAIKSGKDFKTLGGTDLGWAREIDFASDPSRQFTPDFIKQVFSTASGETFRMDQKAGGILLVHVLDRTAPVAKVKLAIVSKIVPVSDKTSNNLNTEINKFLSENGTSDKFVKAANAKGYNLLTNIVLDPSSETVANIPSTRPVIHWAFTEKVGSIKSFDLPEKRIVAMISDKMDGEYAPVTEPSVNKILKDELIKNKKAEKLIAEFNAKKTNSLDGYASAMSLKVDTVNFVSFGSGMLVGLNTSEPWFNVYSNAGQVNKLEGPLKGESGVFVLSVLNKTDSKATFNKDQIKTAIMANFQQHLGYLFQDLKVKMNVKDNRVNFY